MTHTILIVIHAASGVLAFAVGCFAIRRPRLFRVYYVSLIVMATTLALAVAEEWSRIDAVSRIVFAGLTGLALFMLRRAERARRLDPTAGRAVAVRRYQHIGFTLVGLFAAHVVIQVRSFDAPLWLVLGSVAAASIGGHFVLDAVQARWFRAADAVAAAS